MQAMVWEDMVVVLMLVLCMVLVMVVSLLKPIRTVYLVHQYQLLNTLNMVSYIVPVNVIIILLNVICVNVVSAGAVSAIPASYADRNVGVLSQDPTAAQAYGGGKKNVVLYH